MSDSDHSACVASAVPGLSAALSTMATSELGSPGLIDLIRDLEVLKCAAEAAQAAATHTLHGVTVAEHAARGLPVARRGRGVAHQVALARRESPHRAQSHLGVARALPCDMPHLYGAWRAGAVTEYRVQVVFSRVVHLDLDDRRAVDVELAGTPELVTELTAMGEAEARGAADRLAYARDRAGFVRRRAAAEADRHVSSRPAPDCMVRLSAVLPVTDGVGVIAALRLAAEAARNDGDPRSGSQVMADTLVARVTGRDPLTEPVTVNVDVTVPLDTLLDDGTGKDAGGWVEGYGPVASDLARDLAAYAVDGGNRYRRLFTDPVGQLVAMESAARCFPTLLAQFLRRRDKFCRTPWCDAPVRHSDHVIGAAEGGPTSAENGQGLCEACNHAKQAPGWRAKTRTDPDGTHVVETTTPTGHTYDSRPPPAGPPNPGPADLRPPRPDPHDAAGR